MRLGFGERFCKVILSFILTSGFLLIGYNFLTNSKALELTSDSPEVLTMRGLVLFLSAKLPQALLNLQQALRLDPEHEAALQLRRRIKDVEKSKTDGDWAIKKGHLEHAMTTYDAALDVRVVPFAGNATIHITLFSASRKQ
jgi:tetratricopeptide (TPR) repeat protein